MPLDPATQHALEYQWRRMRSVLHDGIPDRKEAALIQLRINDILDRRPRPVAVAGDGEIIWDNASPFVQEQVAGQAEVVYGWPDEPGEPGNDGGVGLLDRP